MTDKTMLEALGEACHPDNFHSDKVRLLIAFVRDYAAEIRHNEMRLRALEMAMGETKDAASIIWARKRADEIMRETEVAG